MSTEPVLFEMSEYYYNSFQMDDSKFFIDNPLGVDPEKTESLVSRTPQQKELKLQPMQKKDSDLPDYLNSLKALSVEQLLFAAADVKKMKTPSNFWIQVQKEGGRPVILDVGEMVSGDKKEYAARKRDGTAQAFALSEANHKKLFDNLDRLTAS